VTAVARNRLPEREGTVAADDHPSTEPPPRRTEQRERLLRTAAQLFAEKGYHGTGVAELGRAVDLGRGGLYHHMGSKEELLVEISVRHVRDMVAVGEEILASEASPPEKLRALSRRLMRTIAESLPEVTVFFHEVNNLSGDARTEVLAKRERFEAIWREVIDEGIAQGCFRTGGGLVTKGLLGMHNYSYVWIDPAGRLQPEEIADVFCDLVLRGLLTDEALASFTPARGA
jgi:AcrR family transcriptional regulator